MSVFGDLSGTQFTPGKTMPNFMSTPTIRQASQDPQITQLTGQTPSTGLQDPDILQRCRNAESESVISGFI